MKPGENLRRLRLEAKHTLKSLAEATGISEGTLNAWELDPDRLKYRNEQHRTQVRRIVTALNDYGLDVTESDIWGIGERASNANDASNTVDNGLMADIALLLVEIGIRYPSDEDVSERARDLLGRVAKYK